jgi:hypothetical protein
MLRACLVAFALVGTVEACNTSNATAAECIKFPDPHNLSSATGKCYFMDSVTHSYKTCEAWCSSNSASMPLIMDSETNDLILSNFAQRVSGVWIGLYQEVSSLSAKKGWDRWVNGCISPLRHWQTDGPSDDKCSKKKYHCALMNSTDGKWNNLACDALYNCVCEYPASTTAHFNSNIDLMLKPGVVSKDCQDAASSSTGLAVAAIVQFFVAFAALG